MAAIYKMKETYQMKQFLKMKRELSKQYAIKIKFTPAPVYHENVGYYNRTHIVLSGFDPVVLQYILVHEVGHHIAHTNGCPHHDWVFNHMDRRLSVFDCGGKNTRRVLGAEKAAWAEADVLAKRLGIYTREFIAFKKECLEFYTQLYKDKVEEDRYYKNLQERRKTRK